MDLIQPIVIIGNNINNRQLKLYFKCITLSCNQILPSDKKLLIDKCEANAILNGHY